MAAAADDLAANAARGNGKCVVVVVIPLRPMPIVLPIPHMVSPVDVIDTK